VTTADQLSHSTAAEIQHPKPAMPAISPAVAPRGTEGAGAVRAVRGIADGLGWKPVAEPLEVTGELDKDALDACYELAATGGLLYPDDLHVSALAATEDRPGHHLGPVVIEEPDLAHRLQRGHRFAMDPGGPMGSTARDLRGQARTADQ